MRVLSRRRVIGTLIAVALVAAAAWAIKTFRHHFFPHDFYVVEPGTLVRGARQSPRMLRKILREYQIRTIVNLDDDMLKPEDGGRPATDPYLYEKTLARESGVQYYRFIWKGSGKGPYQEYDMVADILATTSCRPLFLHCAAGEKRTNAALAAYWIRHRGYSFEQAAEGLRRYGLRPSADSKFLEYLQGYCEYAKRNPRPSPPTEIPQRKEPRN